MRDTSPEVEARFREALMRRSPGERALMAGDMFDAAKQLALAGIRARLGELEPGELRAQLFLQFYGADFGPERRERILARLRALAPKTDSAKR
jgi:hypothetical protein